MDSRRLMQTLDSQKIQCRPLWQPIHQSPAHAASNHGGDARGRTTCSAGLSLPCSVGLTESEQDRVIAAVTAWREIGKISQMSGTNDCHRCRKREKRRRFHDTSDISFWSPRCFFSPSVPRCGLSSGQPQPVV